MTAPLAKILVADDEPDLRALLQRYLGDQGYSVRTVDGAGPLCMLLQRERFDVLVLDVMMPGEDGLSICRRLRAQGETIPILMLTARGDPVDRIVGLEMGADDYLPKPFNPRELLARIQALVRRQRLLGAHTGPQGMGVDGRLAFGGFVLLPAERRLERTGEADGEKGGESAGEDVPLTTSEFALLLALAQNPRRPLGRDRLMALAYGPDHTATDRSIDVQIMRLRKLIEADPARPRHIRTVWGVGYVFMPDGSAPAGGARP